MEMSMFNTGPKIWRPFTQMLGAPDTLKAISAKDALIQLENNKQVIDAISSWWVITHGHCQPEISDAIAKQSQEIDQVLFANFGHKISDDLVSSLSKYLPNDLNKYFFSDNGSTAVEASLKMIIQYWQNLGETNRKTFLSFEHSYHGDTVGAMSVGGESYFTKPYSDMLFFVHRVSQGRYSFDSLDTYIVPFLEKVEREKDKIAGIIIEPLIQGAGGMIMWSTEALEIIGKAARKYSIPIIFDEVMTGFGRTGTLFAFEQLSYNPDVLCLSKGLTGGCLPLSLTITNDKIFEGFLFKDKEKMLFHGHSFTGNPISCAAALANLEIIQKQDMKSKWRNINYIHKERSQFFKGKSYILDVRIKGTVVAIDFKTPNTGYTSSFAEEFGSYSLEQKVFLRPLGNTVYILPPYSITSDELNRVWDVIESYSKKIFE